MHYSINYKITGKHYHLPKSLQSTNQVRGPKRVKMREEINKEGSAKRYQLKQLSKQAVQERILAAGGELPENEELIQVPELDTIRKIASNNSSSSNNRLFSWSDMVNAVGVTLRNSVSGKHLAGFVQKKVDSPQFAMHLYMEKQLECIKQVPKENRILHFDATGGLVNIPYNMTAHQGFKYDRILNYYLVLSQLNTAKEHKASVMVGELVSSSHNVPALKDFFNTYKYNYERCYSNEKLCFR